MKPWLLNILACPIDKHHPLDAYFFRWSTSLESVASAASGASSERIQLLRKQIKEGVISPPSIAAIRDVSGATAAEDLRKQVVEILTRGGSDLGPVFGYLNGLDLAEGLLVCPKCGRWYPVGCSVESVPELMPDELREKEKELEWLEKWSGLVPESVKRSGLPFKP